MRNVVVDMMPGDRAIVRNGRNAGLREGAGVVVVSLDVIYRGRTEIYDMEPGIYRNASWPVVRSEDGAERSVYAGDLQSLAPRRGIPLSDLRIADLPDTAFWEGDLVALPAAPGCSRPLGRVVHVPHADLDAPDAAGKPNPLYLIGLEDGPSVYAGGAALTLAERGNVWKIAHGMAPAFKDLAEEVAFAHSAGRTRSHPNPASGIFAWTPEDMLDALRAGTVDGMSPGSLPGNGLCEAVTCHDRDLGRRFAAASLARLEAEAAPAPSR